MPAFQHAIDLGYQFIETDVHATRDGVLLAFHDEELDRVTDGTGPIAEQDYAEISRARVGGKEPIPLFADLLAAWPNVRINIDPKLDNAVEPLVKLLRQENVLHRVCVTSFSGRRTKWIRDELGADLCTGLGPMGVTRLRFSSLWRPLGGLGGGRSEGSVEGCAQVPVWQYGVRLVDRRFVDRAHELGLQVHVWTIDDPEEMNRLIDLDVDGLMTDQPETLRSVLQNRGKW